MFKDLFNNNWFVSLVSLFFAVLLVISVGNGNSSVNGSPNNTNASIESSVTISNVPVVLGQHDEGTFVSGMPETVSVRLSGPRNIINQLSVENFTVTTESLVGIEPGTRAIRFLAEGLPDTVDYKVTPDLFYAKISTKETMEADVAFELADNLIAEGYMVGNIILDTDQVTLSGSSDEMAKINQVKIVISADVPQTADFSQAYRVQVLDAEGNPLDINISQDEVIASVEVLSTTSQLPIRILGQGEKEGYSYDYQLLSSPTLQVSGQATQAHTGVNLIVDVSDLTASNTVVGYFEPIEGLTFGTDSAEVQVRVTAPAEETTQTDNTETTIEETTGA